ncbi:MAG: carboxypeptidase regulatory-like domain-containing protein [Nitrospira sp.]
MQVTRDTEHCGTTALIRLLSVQPRTGGLEGAIVSLDGTNLPNTDPTVLPLIIDNRRCAFSPLVSVGRVGQPLELRNDDPIMHNTHLKRDSRTFLNVALVPAGRPVRKIFSQPGIYSVACDAHKFMTAHVVVFSHPYASLTDTDGTFLIPHLPPGTYTISVWHNTLGTLRRTVEIPLHGDATLTIEYPVEAESHGQ